MDTLTLSEPTTYDVEGRVVRVGSLVRGLDPGAQKFGNDSANEFKSKQYES